MKLIYITNARIPTEKAHGVQIVKMCEAFSSTGLDIELDIPTRVNPIKEDIFEYYGVNKKFSVRRIFSLDLFWLKLIPEKICFYIQSVSFSLLAVIYALFRRKKTTFFYSRDYLTLFLLCLFGLKPAGEIHDFRFSKFNWFVGYLINKSKILIANSRGTENSLRHHFDIPVGKLVAMPNGVNVDFFDIKESKNQARQQLDMPLGKTIISYIGNLETAGMEKGLSGIIECIISFCNKNQQCVFYVIGGQRDAIEKYKKRLADLKIREKSVIFLGHVRHGSIPLYLRAIDIVIVPGPRDQQFALTTSPMKIFEFLAAGKIIVAANMPSIREYLNDNNAIFFEQEKAGDIYERLKFILDNPDLAERLSKQALADSKQYSWSTRAKKIKELII